MGDLGFEGELGIGLALVGGGEQVGPGYPPAQGQSCLHQHLQWFDEALIRHTTD